MSAKVDDRMFGNIPLLPSSIELQTSPITQPASLPQIYINVPSESLYLDTLLTLFREDGIRSLKKGIAPFLAIFTDKYDESQWPLGPWQCGAIGQGIAELRCGAAWSKEVDVYRVVCVGPTTVDRRNGNVTTDLTFAIPQRLKDEEWDTSMKLVGGSLLCLSASGFRGNGDVLFARGHSRAGTLTGHKGRIKVVFERSSLVLVKQNVEYTMVEGAFYLPYYNVLGAVQRLSRLPFAGQLLRCRQRVEPPAYLSRREVSWESLTGGRSSYGRYGGASHGSSCPSEAALGVEVSQRDALQHALTHRLALIQGPPGTGKTFIGKKLVKLLLNNASLWHHQGPILIVCATNHALDQFLEGIIKDNNLAPGQLLRFGRQSKSSALEPYSDSKVVAVGVEAALKPSGKQLFLATKKLENLLRNGATPTSCAVLDAAAAVRELQAERTKIRTVAKLRRPTVLGMTTTQAAVNAETLQTVGPPIVIAEEAGEVVEAHQLACLSAATQHCVLIGDHQQLRPKPSCMEFQGDPYKLDVSLFERLVRANFPFVKLLTQRRMRPEISALMRLGPFYPRLEDGASVRGRPAVRGLAQPLFFWHHADHEAPQRREETSRRNPAEAARVAALVRHLLLQRYGTSQITVITFYVSQVQVLRSKLDAEPRSKAVEVRTLDGYQGEENEIIILSTVRSRDQGSIGFLSDLNRATVALSRARLGMFVVGNLPYIAANGKLDPATGQDTWRTIYNAVEQRGIGGMDLMLRCQGHGNQFAVTSARELERLSPYGGCTQLCDVQIPCQHKCGKVCHTAAFSHTAKAACTQPCLRKCPRQTKQHACSRRCNQVCDHEPECRVVVEYGLPCGHSAWGACDEPRARREGLLDCLQPCKKQCARDRHSCTGLCYDPCPPCEETITYKLSCGHRPVGPCDNDAARRKGTFDCKEPCEKQCAGQRHKCKGLCKDPCQPCEENITYKLSCQHTAAGPCDTGLARQKGTFDCREPCKKQCARQRHNCKGLCKDQCPPCEEVITHELSCGHRTTGPCDKKKARREGLFDCKEPCKRRCARQRHRCKGLCEDPCPPCRETIPYWPKCGHKVVGLCDEDEARRKGTFQCKEPCEKLAATRESTSVPASAASPALLAASCADTNLHAAIIRSAPVRLSFGRG